MSTIALNMIVLDGAEALQRLLPKVKPFVQQMVIGIDDRTKDASRAVAKRHGARTFLFTFEDDFSKPRQRALDMTKADWMLWLDSDDDIDGLDKLAGVLAEIEGGEGNALYCPYFYEQNPETKRWTLILTRERVIHHPERWHWVNRVHECLVLRDGHRQLAARTPDVVVYHRTPGDPNARSERNIRLLFKSLADDVREGRPYTPRTCYYVARDLLFRGRVLDATHWLGRYLQNIETSDEAYVALVTMAEALMQQQEYGQARVTALQAVGMRSDWADAYYSLMMISAAESKWTETLRWADMGRSAKPRDDLLSINPETYRFDPYLYTSLALLRLGRIPECEAEIAKALEMYPGHGLLRARKALCEALREMALVQEATRRMTEDMKPRARYRFWRTAPPKVRTIEELRKDFVPAPKGRFDVAFLCPVEDAWSPVTKGPLGGSETAVVEMSRLLADRGLKVVVFAHPGAEEGRHGKVWWADSRRLYTKEWSADLGVAWRLPEAADENFPCDRLWLWCHDLHYGERLTEERVQQFDLIVPVSEWHGGYMRRQYPFLEQGMIWPTRNGITQDVLKRAAKPKAKRPHTAIWTSSPDRGLHHAVAMWALVRKAVPDAELHCCYAWGWDRILGAPDSQYVQAMTRTKDYVDRHTSRSWETGVYWHGALSKDALYDLMATTNVWFYPSDYMETFCISALETMAHGCIPVVSECGALPGTLGPLNGFCIPGWVRSPEYEEIAARTVVGLMTSEERGQSLEHVRDMARARAAEMTWESEADRWVESFRREGRGGRVKAVA